MMRISILMFILLFSASACLQAQSAKETTPPKQVFSESEQQLLPRDFAPSVPSTDDPFSVGQFRFQSIQSLNRSSEGKAPSHALKDSETGLPYFIKRKTAASAIQENSSIEIQALDYAKSLGLPKIEDVSLEFISQKTKTDEQGNLHIRLQQVWKGVKVYGGELIAHSHNRQFDVLNGRYFPSPKLESVQPTVEEGAAIVLAKASLNDTRVWTAEELELISGEPYQADLVIFHKDGQSYLAWHIIARPDVLHRHELFLDAHSGDVLEDFDNTCTFDGGRLNGHFHEKNEKKQGENLHFPTKNKNTETAQAPLNAGPVNASGVDLLGINRQFGAYETGGTVYMIDARKSMHNATGSQFPGAPLGVIRTFDGLNKSPQGSNFQYAYITSNNAVFQNKSAAVSAHWNSNLCYDYFESTFSRQSIDGLKGNITAFVNITEDNGASMENAFWNGDAMWYGNGGPSFKPLAAGLDVGGHEMTHGVIEKTANLIYQNESGALNESFADIFGAMIDRDDWKIGEDVMKPGVSPNGALRSLQDPHNGGNGLNSPWWQPKHYSERYTGSQDNGGVHINSGIPNHAFYLFATTNGVGKDKAEKVYYKALDDYLVRSSRFTDCRAAVVQAAEDLYGTTIAQHAANAFEQVGILGANPGGGGGGNPGGNYLGNLSPNPGTSYVLVVSEDQSQLKLADANGNILGTIYNNGVLSRPSVTDDGSEIVFINGQNHIVDIFLTYSSGTITPNAQIISSSPIWRNVAISKNGRFIAALTDNQDNTVNVFDFGVSPVASKVFSLYNPTFTSGQVTNNVDFADVLEFDYSGEYLMYDAQNALTNNQGQNSSYWDVGFLQFFDNNQFTDGADDIGKLFSGLPEGLSIGNPVFSKLSPYIIAFDLIDGIEGKYYIYGANIETGDNGSIVNDNGDLGYPTFDRLDQSILFESPWIFGKDILRQGLAASKIAPAGQSDVFVESHVWATWFSNGNRSLMVDEDEPVRPIAFEISPNPAQNELFLDINLPRSGAAQVAVFDVAGRVVLEKNEARPQGKQRIELEVGSLKSGLYFISLLSEGQRVVASFVKE